MYTSIQCMYMCHSCTCLYIVCTCIYTVHNFNQLSQQVFVAVTEMQMSLSPLMQGTMRMGAVPVRKMVIFFMPGQMLQKQRVCGIGVRTVQGRHACQMLSVRYAKTPLSWNESKGIVHKLNIHVHTCYIHQHTFTYTLYTWYIQCS